MSYPKSDAQKRAMTFTWISELTQHYRPAPDTPEYEALKKAKITTATKWHKFRLWCIWLVINTSRYGRDMDWSQLTISEQSGIGLRRVRQNLEAAEALGWIVKASEATGFAPAVYYIARSWEPSKPQPAAKPDRDVPVPWWTDDDQN